MAYVIAAGLLAQWFLLLAVYPLSRQVIGPVPMVALAVIMGTTAELCDRKHENAIVITRLLAMLFAALAVFILVWVLGSAMRARS